ncbi:MAG: OsmC family peroxiredoxin [Sphingobacteriales bacterium]|nr:MAG: OsmC family peroxiredoxin [Sphingobacteriales bacterium]
MDKHLVSTSFGNGMASSAAIGNHNVIMDTTADNGGTDSGPGPKRLMLASLAGCTGIDIVSILTKMKVAYSDLSIDTEGTLTEEHPKIYNHVKLTYKIKLTQEADRAKMEKAVALSEEKYCGVMAMFRSFAKMEREIVWL